MKFLFYCKLFVFLENFEECNVNFVKFCDYLLIDRRSRSIQRWRARNSLWKVNFEKKSGSKFKHWRYIYWYSNVTFFNKNIWTFSRLRIALSKIFIQRYIKTRFTRPKPSENFNHFQYSCSVIYSSSVTEICQRRTIPDLQSKHDSLNVRNQLYNNSI